MRVEHPRIYDMRHTLATWNLAAGMGILTLARRHRSALSRSARQGRA
jgi:integrase